ncbi:fumarylacetoacetase [Frigoriglobus tundricola]|uniref:fumarylacetoacetase n=1 Tax=Frigoriglobus tundricola TaxID=2774151 RepID=A0A6M5Z004_9BACT|nr:fumarylacetoacetase [Frigoriglobus tundricola]QJW99468.1 Fumarylacetoacetase [Frigoriglobus tundricola]
MTDDTHDPARRSWVDSANRLGCDFPIQNLPLGVFVPPGDNRARVGVAIGDAVLDASAWLPGETLNAFCALPAGQRADLRKEWVRALEAGAAPRPLFAQTDCRMLLPTAVGDYTDFYASIHHATNVGKLFRPDNPLLPNYKHVPIAYHGRASSLVVSGTPVRRPNGQLAEGKFGPTRELDYEVEVGLLLGPGNDLGSPIAVADARQHIAGVCLVNDWSARDVQRWEYQPLGPFLAKNFGTSVSPWVVTAEALAPFWASAPPHDVPVLPYLQESPSGALDISVEVWLRTPAMADAVRMSHGQFKEMYWTPGQMIAHHTSNGCRLRPGDLIASGTVSGPGKENRGCLLELTSRGTDPVPLPDGETRTYLQDGDEVTLTAHCERPGFARIGFGSCSGVVLPAIGLG